MKNKLIFLFILILLSAAPSFADRDLTIDAVNLNGFTGRDISVKPGARIYGNVTVTTNSTSLFRTHTGVWLPSWDKRNEALRIFLNSMGGAAGVIVDIDINAPMQIGTHYLLFCFDRKKTYEMFNEITLRTDDAIYANGKAIKIIVDPLAPEPVKPNSKERALELTLNGPKVNSIAGYGDANTAWFKVRAGSFSSDDGIMISLDGSKPQIDLDFEIVDEFGRRKGWSENEGSQLETSIVRVKPYETVYVKVFAFKQGEEASFSIFAKQIKIAPRIIDPSGGRALLIASGYRATARVREGDAGAQWYSVAFPRDGSFTVEVRGSQPERDIDLWVYDDLGNIRASSKREGSALESISMNPAESGIYYIKVGAYKSTDISDFSISLTAYGAQEVAVPTEKEISADSKQKCPVSFQVSKDRPFEGFIKISKEPSFIVEVFSGWGDEGKIDSIKVFGPDNSLLWNAVGRGKGWEAERINSRGQGMYKIRIEHNGTIIRKGKIDLQGADDPHIYFVNQNKDVWQPGEGGSGLDSAERDILQKLYQIFDIRGKGISSEESNYLNNLEEYFRNN